MFGCVLSTDAWQFELKRHRGFGSMWQTEVFLVTIYQKQREQNARIHLHFPFCLSTLKAMRCSLEMSTQTQQHISISQMDLSVAKLEMKINHHNYLCIDLQIFFFASEIYPEMFFQIPKFVYLRSLHIGHNYRGRKMIYGRQGYPLTGARIVCF